MIIFTCRICFDRGVVRDITGTNRICPACHGMSCMGPDEYDAPGVLDDPLNRYPRRTVPATPRKAPKPKYGL